MIMKRFNNQQTYCSWEDEEEVAFAKDTANEGLGGGRCIWPPRSYSCSFCKREFRSAQALGGHMNVHRRDRALLKQVTIPSQPLDHHDHDHDHRQNHHVDDHKRLSKSMVTLNSSQLCLPRTNVPHLTSPKISSTLSQVITPSHNQLSGLRKVVSTTNDVVQLVELGMGLDFTKTGQYRKVGNTDGGGEEEEYTSSKRCKKSDNDHVALLPFFDNEFKCSNPKEVPGLKEITLMEDLDLELRLGDPTSKAKYSN